MADERVVVAFSGGLDSTVLLHLLAARAPTHGLRVSAAHVNHGLRGAASEADAAAAAATARRLEVPFAVLSVDPESLRRGQPSSRRPTLQEAARTTRYRALLAHAQSREGARLATAHHADDQAETVLLRLLRGCGPDGLAGIPERSADGIILRPLLHASREAIHAYAREQGLSWREDDSNRNPRFARSRLRQRWLPGLAREFNPRLLRTIANLAEAQQRDREWIDALVEEEARRRMGTADDGSGGLAIAREGWNELPLALRRRLLRLVWRSHGGGRDVSRTHLERMEQLVAAGRPGSVIELPGGFRLGCERAAAILWPPREGPAPRC